MSVKEKTEQPSKIPSLFLILENQNVIGQSYAFYVFDKQKL